MNYNILDHISSAFFIINLETTTIEYLNEEAKILLKLPHGTDLDQGMHFFGWDCQWGSIKERAVNFLTKEQPVFSFEQSILRYDNTFFSTSIKCGYADDKNETIYLVLHDVKDYKNANLDSSSMALRGFAVIIVDDFLTIKYANNRFYEILGFKIEQLLDLDGFLSSICAEEKETFETSYKKQLRDKDYIDLKCRIITKENKLRWVCFRGDYIKSPFGFDEIYCSVREIGEEKALLDKFISAQQFYNIAKDTLDDILFQFTIKNGHMEQYGPYLPIFGLPYEVENFPDFALDNKIILGEDIPIFLQIFENMRKGVTQPLEFRMVDMNDNVEWYRVKYKLLFDRGVPVQANGRIINIQNRKVLEERASVDSLTKCLNKRIFYEKVSAVLEKSLPVEQHAFIILDIDNFKSINDNLGHHFGDIVLAELSGKLKSSFRSSDYVGRIGGDEFVIFLRDFLDMSMLIKKVEVVLELFRSVSFKEVQAYAVSASIGIALFSIDGMTYDELYEKSDVALYYSKNRGKNCYSLYDKGFLGYKKEENRTPVRGDKEVLLDQYYDAAIASVFNLLHESNDIDTSINIVLSRLGDLLGVDRCYIFETVDNGIFYSNTFEWCNTNIASDMEFCQNMTRNSLSEVFSRADQNGISSCNSLSMLPSGYIFDLMTKLNIKSFMHSIIEKNNTVDLLVGVDSCTQPRVWSAREMAVLMYVSKTLAIFLSREKMLRKLQKLSSGEKNS